MHFYSFIGFIVHIDNISVENKNAHNTIRRKNELDNQFVIAWNRLAYTIANEHDQFYSFTGVRTLVMTHR
jgi:hypothetical protein